MTTITHGQKSAGWAICDPVTGLRRWGRRDTFDLPIGVESLIVGAADTCAIRIHDDIGSVSRQHAELTYDSGTWTLKDLGSKNGTRLDGERRLSFALMPGIEVELGEVKLIAESDGILDLHRFIARIVGMGDARLPHVDQALRDIRDAAARRTVLMLCGAGNLISTARRLHDLSLGAERPFIVANERAVGAFLDAAVGGTLCVQANASPADLAYVREADACALVVCAPTAADAADVVAHVQRAAIVELPPLDSRPEDRDQLLLEYAADAVRTLGVSQNGFREHELHWLRDAPLANLADVEELMLRLVVERNFGVTHGAAKLGITHTALSTYLRRRGIPL